MERRRYLLGGTSLGVCALAGCLSRFSAGGDGPDLVPPEDLNAKTVATATFDEDVTPICAAGTSMSGSVEGPNAEFVSAHEFFHDAASGRYGVRGRIEPGERGNVPSVRAAFSTNDSATDRIYGVDSDETYLFTITTTEGDPDGVDGYTLHVDDGMDSDWGIPWEGYATIDGEWGEIGDYNGTAVYGCVATVTNERDESIELYPRCKAYLDERSVAYSGEPIERVIELSPTETRTVHFPYPRCDPGAIDAIEPWLEWSTMSNP